MEGGGGRVEPLLLQPFEICCGQRFSKSLYCAMSFTEDEIQTILNDNSKKICGNILWTRNKSFSDIATFNIPIISDGLGELTLRGSYNLIYSKISFVIVYKQKRIYSLDIGHDHTNRKTKTQKRKSIGSVHKHKWSRKFKDAYAYQPDDITAKAHEVEKAWKEFCIESKITHEGIFYHPSQRQQELFQ